MRVKGERVYLRELDVSDASIEYSNWLSDPEVNKYLTSRNLTIEEIKNFIKEQKDNPNCLFVGIFVNENDKHIGNIKLEPIDFKRGKATFGILIGDKNYWGKGIGKEAMNLIIDYAFDNLNLKEINLGVAINHVGAIKLYEKLGFVKGKINKGGVVCGNNIYDQLIMTKINSKIEIVAEIAQGFEGNEKLAKLLTLGAIKGGADSIKYQLVYADELATPDYHYYKLFKSLEMPDDVWREIVTTVHKAGKKVYFDVFGMKSLALAKELGIDGVKLSTTEFYNYDLIKAVLNSNFSKVFLSVGGIPIEDIKDLIQRENIKPEDNICFMYGFQSEPTPIESNNLLKMVSLKEEFKGFNFGFMDHSKGDQEDAFYLPIMTLATGIKCIEKHITLDPLLEVEDYISALTPTRFKKFVNLVRKYEVALGSSSLELTPLEIEYRNKAGKVVVALKDINVGEELTINNVGLKRVGDKWKDSKKINTLNKVLGKTVNLSVKLNEPIVEELI